MNNRSIKICPCCGQPTCNFNLAEEYFSEEVNDGKKEK